MKLKSFFNIAMLSLLAVSCNKDFGDTNENPNLTPTPSTEALLTNVLSGLGGFASQTRGGLYAQQVSETQYTEVSLYALPRLEFDGIYAASLYDLDNIILNNTADSLKLGSSKFGSHNNQIAIARILKAYTYWTITDRWGDVPYFDALQGDANLAPAYNTQEEIYKDLIKELKEANAQFDNGNAASGDIVYDGTGEPWIKFSNSLRMLIALRTSKVYPNAGQWAATEFAAAFNDPGGYISSNDDNFVLHYPGNVAAFRNPWYNLYNGRTDFAESELMTDLMEDYGDPRQDAFGSSEVGFPYGLTRDDAVKFATDHSDYAQVLAGGWRGQASPLVVIGYSHVALAIAEAAQRGWITANVEDFYKEGIAASWEQWEVAGDLDVYYDGPNVTLASGNPLTKIQMQQYISWYPDGIQAWSNWRRTNVPALVPTPHATNSGGQIPRRYVYGTREYTLNTTNVQKAAATYNNDSPDARVWWDKP